MENVNLEELEQNQVVEDIIEEGVVPNDYILTDMLVKRSAFDSKKEPGKKLYSYTIDKSLTLNNVTKAFNISLVPAVKKNANNEVSDFGGYMILDLIFAFGDVPLYLQKIIVEDKTYIKYYVLINTSDGVLAQAVNPRSGSDKTILEFFRQKFLKG